MLRAAGEENLYQKVTVVPKRLAQEWPLRAAAKFPVHPRKITAEVSEVVQGVGIWLARTFIDCREWRYDRLMLAVARSCRGNAITSDTSRKTSVGHWMK